MLIFVGEDKKRALLRCVYTGWYYVIFISEQDIIIPTEKRSEPLMKLSMLLNLSTRGRRISLARFILELKEISIR
jgi:hypothetical protein